MVSGRPHSGRWSRDRGFVKRGFAVLVVVAATLLALAPPHALAASRHAAMTIDANSGQVLHEQSADEPRYPASLTKMMTLYIVFELIEQGRLQPAQRIRISPTAAATPPSRLGLEAGAEITVMQAVQALIVKSANDMAVAVAEHIAGSETRFAALMTQKARQLGMTRTTFRNAHGLPDPGQVTTARDMLTLALRLHDDFPRHFHLFSLRTFAHAGVVHRNHNTMLTTYRGMDGLKTGYTGPSGFNLVASVRRDGKHVVAAVFGGSSAAARNAYMRVMLDRTLPRAATQRTRQPTLIAKTRRGEAVAQRSDQPKLVEPIQMATAPRQPAVEAPPQVRRAPAQKPVSAPAAPALKPIPLEPAQPEPPAATVAAPGAPVEIARVRPVVVAPRPPRSVEPASAAAPGPIATSPPDARATAGAVSPARPDDTHARGTLPSSLQAQAERLQRGAPPVAPASQRAPSPVAVATAPNPASRLQGPAAGAPAAQTVMIQIGAFSSETEAVRQLQIAREKAAAILATAKPITMPTAAGGRQLYRARFSGFDSANAAAACLELRRHQIDCHVTSGS